MNEFSFNESDHIGTHNRGNTKQNSGNKSTKLEDPRALYIQLPVLWIFQNIKCRWFNFPQPNWVRDSCWLCAVASALKRAYGTSTTTVFGDSICYCPKRDRYFGFFLKAIISHRHRNIRANKHFMHKTLLINLAGLRSESYRYSLGSVAAKV
jgi:hypothetical protein